MLDEMENQAEFLAELPPSCLLVRLSDSGKEDVINFQPDLY